MSLTPVGDYLAKRYPPNDGATHWTGRGDDPGCCAGGHPACLYSVAWREALRSFAAQVDARADTPADDRPPELSGDRGTSVLRAVAAMAREWMEESP